VLTVLFSATELAKEEEEANIRVKQAERARWRAMKGEEKELELQRMVDCPPFLLSLPRFGRS
jgi:hypothetical protein